MNDNYQNPINKPEMVTIPVWEYAELVSKSNTLDILRLMAENNDSYGAGKLLDVIYKQEEEAEE